MTAAMAIVTSARAAQLPQSMAIVMVIAAFGIIKTSRFSDSRILRSGNLRSVVSQVPRILKIYDFRVSGSQDPRILGCSAIHGSWVPSFSGARSMNS